MQTHPNTISMPNKFGLRNTSPQRQGPGCAQNQGATDCSGVIVVGQEDNPLDSFMNYVDDQCMHRFSFEQVKRMQETVVMIFVD